MTSLWGCPHDSLPLVSIVTLGLRPRGGGGGGGAALMTVWSKVLPLTASCLAPLPSFNNRPGHVRNLPVTWG